MRRVLAGIALLPWAAASDGAELLRYRFNGLEVEATYARGVEAGGVVTRFLEMPPVAPGEARSSWVRQGDWRQIATYDRGISRVLQVRGQGDDLEAIASTLDTSQAPAREPPPPLWLPPASILTSQVQFMRPTPSLQWVIRSAWRPDALSSWLSLSARIRGWSVNEAQDATGLQLRRKGEHLNVVVMPLSNSRLGGSVVVLTRWRAR